MKARRAHFGIVSGLLALALLFTASLPVGATPTTAKKDNWGQFVRQRTQLLQTLAEPVEYCFAQTDIVDRESPMFNGCWDWHSAVHAAYSLHLFYRRTGDIGYLETAEEKIKPFRSRGRTRIHAYEDPQQGKPYGFSWLLALVKEREEATGKNDLRPLADEAVAQVRAWVDDLTPGRTRDRVLTDAYAKYRGRSSTWSGGASTRTTSISSCSHRPRLAGSCWTNLDTLCPVEQDTRPDQREFFPPCLMRLAAVAQVWDTPPAQVRSWIVARLPDEGLSIEPVTDPVRIHAGGLNFSRAYTLWHIYQATNDTDYRQNFTDLIRYHISRRDLWAEDYYSHSHWVPQFGVRAIAQTNGGRGQPPR